MQRGLERCKAMAMIVRGFVEPIARELADGVRTRTEPPDLQDGRIQPTNEEAPVTTPDHPR